MWDFTVNKVALEPIFSEYLCFPCHFSFHRLLHIHRHPSSGAGAPSGLSLTPPQDTKKKKEERSENTAAVSLENVLL
jgi:hypothetical protein